MKTIHFLALLLFLVLASTDLTAQTLRGQGPTVSQEIKLDPFNGIGLSIAADVEITRGNPQKVVIEGQQNIIDHIKRSVRSGSWEIGFDVRNVNSYDKVVIRITIPELTSVAIAGSGDVKTMNAFNTKGDFELSISGSGNAWVDISARDVACSVSGSGNASLQGSAEDLEISIAGSGDVKAFDLKAARCAVSTAGSGDSEVMVRDELKASIVGSGDVYYQGSPKIKASVIGSGEVREKN